MAESDAQRLEMTPARAFDWVARELEMPTPKALNDLRRAFLSIHDEGHSKAVRVLERNWPDGARWPSGEAYLRTLGWRTPDEFANDDDDDADADADEYEGPELMELLFQRLLQVGSRMYRDAQVLGLLSHRFPHGEVVYSHLHLNRNADWRGDPCGIGIDRIVIIQEGMVHLQHPAHEHPACRCTIDPVEARIVRAKAARGSQ